MHRQRRNRRDGVAVSDAEKATLAEISTALA